MSEFLKSFGKTGDKKQDPVPESIKKVVEVDRTPVQQKSRTRPAPRKSGENYKLVNEGDLYQIIKDCLKGEFPVEKATLGNMKKNFARQPFGGNRKGGGGWNSTAYALFEALVKSEKLHIKK